MATNNRGGSRGGNRGGNRGRAGRNNNPEGRNQYSGVMSSARENPLAAAAAIGGAVAAGVFLWSRRNQISDQIGMLSDQFGEWREGLDGDSQFGEEGSSGESFMANSNPRRGNRKSQAEISEEVLTLKETGKPA
ncbi:MAG: hypothetical protein ABI770_04120 [Sphingomicrobium sp.]